MKPPSPLWRHARAVLPCTLGLLAGLATGCRGCSHESTPAAADAQASTTAYVPSATMSPSAAAAWRGRHPRDDAGNLIPKSSPPPADPRDIPPQPGRDPDWDLDTADSARDYVRRYVLGTRRYGGSLDCVDIGPSTPSGDRRKVEVKASASCPEAGPAGELRDVFMVDVAGDRLTVDDKAKRNPLARWPDGSDPEGPPGAVQNTSDLRKWRGPLKDAVFGKQQLVVIRVQMYGRGTYPVITVAGWHGAVMPTATTEDLRSFADDMCHANEGPLGIFAGLDRSRILLIRCPGGAHWEKL